MNLIKKHYPETEFIRSTVAFLVDGDQVLLGLRKKVSLGLGSNLFSGVGGKVDPGETDVFAIKREVSEEIGVIIKSFRSMGRVEFIFPDKKKWCHTVAIFIVHSWEGTIRETYEIQPVWFKKTELPFEQMWPDSPLWLPSILSEEKFDGVILYNEEGKVAEHIKGRFYDEN